MASRSSRFGGLLAVCLLAACAPEDGAPGLALAGGGPPAPERAPTTDELLEGCPDPAPTEQVRIRYRAQDFAWLDGEFERRLDRYTGNRHCEPYVWHLIAWTELRWNPDHRDLALADRWASQRPGSWAAHTVRGADRLWQASQQKGSTARESFAAARRDLERAIELEPRNILAYGHRVELQQALGAPDGVRPVLDRLDAVDPANYGVRRRAVEALWPPAGSVAAIREIAEAAQPHAGESPRLVFLMGYASAARASIALRQGRDEDAIAGYREALRYGDHTGWYNTLCSRLYARGDFRGTVEDTTRWIAFDPANPRPWILRGLARSNLRQFPRAIADTDRALELAPRDAATTANRGWMRDQVGDRAGAIADFTRTLELDPRNTTALAELAAIRIEQERYDEAEALARHWMDVEPERLRPRFFLGHALHARGDPEGTAILRRYVERAEGARFEARHVARARRILAATAASAGTKPGASNEALPGLGHVLSDARP